MRFLNLHRITLALLLTAALGLVGCRDAHEEMREDTQEQFATHLQVTIRINADAGHGTRAAGPDGGEDGDGREPGVNHENDVDNVTLLLYQDDDGINTTNDNTTIRYAFYTRELTRMDTDLGGGKKVITYTSKMLNYREPVAQGTYHVLVLANVGCRTDLEGKKLSEVRELTTADLTTPPYTLTYDAATGVPDIANAANFVMTSVNDVSVTIEGDGGLEHIKNVTANVERLAARIDFSPGLLADAEHPQDKDHAVWTKGEDVTAEIEGVSTTKKLTGYKYVVRTVTDGTPIATNDRFILTGVTPFNCLKSGTYYIKRVMNTLGSGAKELKYLGDEQTDADGNGINYVVDPWTDQKSLDTPISGIGYRNPLTSPEELLPEANRWPVKAPSALAPVDVNPKGLEYYILDYTQENTLPPGYGKEHYATGLQFSGYYGHWDEVTHTYTYKPQNYHYYIRHADPNNSSNEGLPMKYGVVRNNIYRIHVGSVNSLGQIEIVVSEWNRIDVPGIQL